MPFKTIFLAFEMPPRPCGFSYHSVRKTFPDLLKCLPFAAVFHVHLGGRRMRVEGRLEGKHGAVGTVPPKQQRHHGGSVLQWVASRHRCLGSGNHSRD